VKAEEEGEAAAWAKYRTLSSDLDGINQAIGSSQVSNERCNILWSLNNAFAILAESTDPNKEVYVILPVLIALMPGERSRIWSLSPFFVSLSLYLLWRFYMLNGIGGYPGN